MRGRDNFETCLTRIRSRILAGDYAAALDECNLAEQAYEPHWRIDLNRGVIHTIEGRLKEAQVYLDRVKIHNIGCNDRFCLSQGVYITLCQNAYNSGLNDEAFHYINVFLREQPEDIFGLWLRGMTMWDPWQNRTCNNEFLEKAIEDFRTAYALIRKMPDNKFYRLKIIRDLSQGRAADLESRCEDTSRMYDLMKIDPIPDARTVETNDFLDPLNDPLNPFLPAGFAHMHFVPAGAVHIYIGLSLANCLLEKKEEEDCWVEMVDICDEIEPLAQQHGDAELLAEILILASAANFDIYTLRQDINYLDAAKSNLRDLQGLSNTYTLNNEMLEYIEGLETEIDNFTNASDA